MLKERGGGEGVGGQREGICSLRERERERENEGGREVYAQILHVPSFCDCMRVHSQIHPCV